MTINEVSQWVYSEMFGYLPFSEFDQQLTQPCISQDIQDTQNISRSTNWLSHVYYTLLDSWTNIFLQDIPQEHTLCTDQDDTGRTDIQERPRGG
ncbi:MAG: hypothetical protein U9Q15_01765 [Patescibacteria group bacterium]|nr:hypothetical protein [Patescibacteria group bacterium]